MKVKSESEVAQSCLTLCDPIDGSPPGSPVPGILQARTLEWGAISFSNAWQWKMKVKSLSRVRLIATPWTAGYQAPPSMGFSRQEYWNGVPLPSPSVCPGLTANGSSIPIPRMRTGFRLYMQEPQQWLKIVVSALKMINSFWLKKKKQNIIGFLITNFSFPLTSFTDLNS